MICEDGTHCYVIAEAGVNHNGSIDLAHQLIDIAADVGVDAVKFQTFRADRLVTHNAPKAQYQVENTSGTSQLAMLKALELSDESHHELLAHCQDRGIEFLSTPFDVGSLNFLVNDLGVSRLKLGSGDLTNALLLLTAAQTKLPIILSTGMSLLGEIEKALAILAYGYLGSNGHQSPSSADFEAAYVSLEGQRLLAENVTLLHCTTEYPTPLGQVNLRVMDTLMQAFQVSGGLSDHTLGISAAIAAVARGAKVIEKHFTLDKQLPGPDHCASLDGQELKQLVKSIREVELALGNPVKHPVEAELKNRQIVRRGLVAACPIRKGERFSRQNLDVKRGGNVSALEYWDWLGFEAQRDYQPDEAIQE